MQYGLSNALWHDIFRQKVAENDAFDISAKITDELINQIGDANWKNRRDALAEVKSLFEQNKFVTAELGGLPGALAKRLGDVNKVWVAHFVMFGKLDFAKASKILRISTEDLQSEVSSDYKLQIDHICSGESLDV